MHGQLTVHQALMYAAELRLPPDTTKADRAQVVAQVLEELEMTNHVDTRVDKLSGGQRKRASVALELLTGPSLLILDEPTSGLDPALDRQVMTMLRQLADAGRVVLVVTHSLTYLDVCDQVLLLAPGGKTAFCGPPSQIGPTHGHHQLGRHLQHRRGRSRRRPTGGSLSGTARRHRRRPRRYPPTSASPTRTSVRQQFSTIARRQMRLIVSDRGYFIFPGGTAVHHGRAVAVGARRRRLRRTRTAKGGEAPNEPGQILVLLNVGAIFMGTALTIRALIGERAIFQREQAVGLSTTAYMLAKVFVFAMFAVMQSAIVTAINMVGKRLGPGAVTSGAVIGSRTMELLRRRRGRCVAAAMVGLALSALAKSNEQIMPLLVIAIMSQLVFQGGMIPVTGRIVLDQLSWVTPARWGFASDRVDDRSHQARARSADSSGLALEAHGGRLAVQHGHARRDLRRLPELRAMEDPPQDGLMSAAVTARVGPR